VAVLCDLCVKFRIALLDLKSALPAKHAQHVALIHFRIALVVVSVVFDLLGFRKNSLALFNAAYYTAIAASISAAPAMATGILAWQLQFGGKPSRGNLRLHMMLALFSSVMIWLACWLHFQAQRKPQQPSPRLRSAIEIVAVLLTVLTGHVGGFVSGVNGPG
jgi:uncharacterized membrane protein